MSYTENLHLATCRGFVVSVVKDLSLPIKFIGVGEKIEDLRLFQPEVLLLICY